ncbi:MAG: DinB family protein [Deltaproteobacteria bacterium]
MFPKNYYELMAEYNKWMDYKIYGVCSGIPDALRKKDMGAFFKSIHSTLNHIYYGDIAWLERLRDNKFTPREIGADLFDDFEELRAAQEKTDVEILEWARSLTPEDLNSEYDYESNVKGFKRTLPRWVLVTHMFNHQTHHRGQVTTLIKQLGIDPGITDIPWLPCLEDK